MLIVRRTARMAGRFASGVPALETIMSRLEPLKVLFVSHSAGLYGAERSMLTLVEGLLESGGVDVAVMLPDRGPLELELRARGIETRVFRYCAWIGGDTGIATLLRRLSRFRLTLFAAFRARRWVRNWAPDIIYSNSIASPMGLFLAAVLRLPHIWHLRELVVEQMGERYDLGEKLSMALIGRWTQGIVCNSRVVAERMESLLPRSPPVVIYNGFDFSDLPVPRAAEKYDRTVADPAVIRLAILGSVQSAKGQEDGIRALARLVSNNLPVVLDIIGDGPADYRAELESLAETLSVKDRVLFKGFTDDVGGVLSDSAVTLMTSRFEVFGRVVVESLAYGTPVVAARAGGILEVVKEGTTGLCYCPGNHEELAAKIAMLIADRTLYERLVSDGWRDATRRFSKEAYVNAITGVLFQASERGLRFGRAFESGGGLGRAGN